MNLYGKSNAYYVLDLFSIFATCFTINIHCAGCCFWFSVLLFLLFDYFYKCAQSNCCLLSVKGGSYCYSLKGCLVWLVVEA